MSTPNLFIDRLKKYVGVPYKYGGKTSAGLDCSGLIWIAMNDLGKVIPHGSGAQIEACTPISVDEAWATPGAMLWREGHNAISLGDGTTIEAITPKVTITNRTETFQGKPRFTRGGLLPHITYTEAPRMHNPTIGQVTSEFSPSRRHPITGKMQMHAGIDIANKTGTDIRAAFAGVVEKAGTNIVSGRTGLGVLIRNPDGERQYYGHLSSIGVRVGQQVLKGAVIGAMGATGNATGPHLHFETWNKNSQPVNPRIYFNYHGITPGVGGSVAPKPPVSQPANPKSDPKVLAYQKRQNAAGNAGLYEDGINGPKTRAWKTWVRQAQTALNAYKGVSGQVVIDGDYGPRFNAQVTTVQQRNSRALYVDGILGNKMAAWMRKQGSKLPNRP